MNKLFAPQYTRLDGDVLDIPDDTQLRREVLKYKVEHPSKNNLYVLDALAEYLCNPGDKVLDPMAGSGSTMYLSRRNLSVMLIELNKYYYNFIKQNAESYTGVNVIQGDCRELLPWPNMFNLIVFSPPYANQIKANTGAAVYDINQRGIAEGIEAFATEDARNLGTMPTFWFNQAMQDVYRKCYASLVPGGHMAVLTKDKINKGLVEPITQYHVSTCLRLGFELTDWFQHTHIGKLWGYFNLKHGVEQVQVEDIVIYRRKE